MGLIASPFQIDWSHPISRNLFDCFFFDPINYGKNLANAKVGMTTNSGAKFTATIDGPAGACAGGSFFSFPNHGNLIAGDFTIRCRFVTSATPGGSFTNIYSKGATGCEYRAYMNGSNALSFLEFGGGGNLGLSATFNGVGLINDFVFTKVGTTVTVYLNGASANSATTATATTADPVATQLAVETGGGNTAGSFQYTLFQTWLRGLGANEVRQLYFDTTLMLKKRQFVYTSAVVSSAISFRRTLSPLGARSGSRQLQGWG